MKEPYAFIPQHCGKSNNSPATHPFFRYKQPDILLFLCSAAFSVRKHSPESSLIVLQPQFFCLLFSHYLFSFCFKDVSRIFGGGDEHDSGSKRPNTATLNGNCYFPSSTRSQISESQPRLLNVFFIILPIHSISSNSQKFSALSADCCMSLCAGCHITCCRHSFFGTSFLQDKTAHSTNSSSAIIFYC